MEDTSRLLLALVAFQENLDETDEDLPPELLPALEKLATKLQIAPVSQEHRMHRILVTACSISPFLESTVSSSISLGLS